MKITITGHGRVATALGEGWSRAGHEITYAVRNPEADDLAELREDPAVQVRAMEGAAADADVVVLAVPAGAALDAARSLGELGSAIIVDPTNPLTPERTLDPSQSAAPHLAELYPQNAIVKAFNTTGWINLRSPDYPDGPLTMPICGNNMPEKLVVYQLVIDLGFEPLDCGGLESVPLLENLALFWITLANSGSGPYFGIRVVERGKRKVGGKTRQEILDVIEQLNLPLGSIAPIIRPCMEFYVTDGEVASAPGMQLGGTPLLPVDMPWPTAGGRPMSFIAQVDLSSQPADLSDDGFPSSGHLLFFYDIEGLWLSGEDLGAGYDPEDPRQNHCVLYFPEHIEMVRKDFPEALPKEYRYPEHPLRAIAASDIPPEESAAVRSLDLTAEQRNCYYGIAGDEDGLWSERAILGGYPDQAQGDLMELAAERSDVLDFEKDLSVRQRALTWRQILQVPSTRIDGNYVMSWGDAGCLHFYIRDSDLREARFDRTYLEMQF